MSQGQMTQTSVSRSSSISMASNEPPDVVHEKGILLSRDGLDSSSHTDSDDGSEIKFRDWGFQIDRLFDVAYRFYKRNESKAFHPSFDERNQLIALILQARYGNFDDGKAPDVGALDLVGRSRRQHWATLKGMSKTEAMSKFISNLNELCPFFKAHVEAVKISCDPQTTPDGNQQISNSPNQLKKDDKLKTIYTSLCRQTYQQFKGYASKQYPDDVQQQKYLISSLQWQYYQQYISQMHPDLNNCGAREQLKSSLSPAASESSSIAHDNGDNILTLDPATRTTNQSNDSPSPKPSEVEATSNSIPMSDNPLISIVGDNVRNIASHLSNSNQKDNFDCVKPNKQTAQQDYDQVPAKISVTKLEPCLPKPNPYDPTDLQSIGKFESFPKPKPIPNHARPMNEIQVMAPKNTTKEQRPAYTAIELGEEAPTKEAQPESPPSLPPQELPPPPPQELPPPPELETQASFIAPKNDMPQTGSDPPRTNDLNNRPSTGQEACLTVTPADNRPPLKLWDCDGSSSGGEDSPLEQQSITYEPIEPASTWTKRGSNEFKESLVDDKHGGMYVVKQGTLVTIQVPTYLDGRYIYWEFATDEYDIGFGLDFVYQANLEKPLAIKIFEETDEDDDEDLDEAEEAEVINQTSEGDTEAALSAARDRNLFSSTKQKRAEKFARLANTVSIIPTYRRDSHEEIFVGKHKYPGRGYYLLKFDNTYSVLRSKTIFFRICYFI